MSAIFRSEIRERCKGVHCVDLGESFPTSIHLQNLASIQPRTSSPRFAEASKRYPPPVINLALVTLPLRQQCLEHVRVEYLHLLKRHNALLYEVLEAMTLARAHRTSGEYDPGHGLAALHLRQRIIKELVLQRLARWGVVAVVIDIQAVADRSILADSACGITQILIEVLRGNRKVEGGRGDGFVISVLG